MYPSSVSLFVVDGVNAVAPPPPDDVCYRLLRYFIVLSDYGDPLLEFPSWLVPSSTPPRLLFRVSADLISRVRRKGTTRGIDGTRCCTPANDYATDRFAPDNTIETRIRNGIKTGTPPPRRRVNYYGAVFVNEFVRFIRIKSDERVHTRRTDKKGEWRTVFQSSGCRVRMQILTLCEEHPSDACVYEVQILKALILGEEERGQSQYQVVCMIFHFDKNSFISSDAMSKLRQKNPSTIRTPEEDLGRTNYTMDYSVVLPHSGLISPHISELCAEAGEATYTRHADLVLWAASQAWPLRRSCSPPEFKNVLVRGCDASIPSVWGAEKKSKWPSHPSIPPCCLPSSICETDQLILIYLRREGAPSPSGKCPSFTDSSAAFPSFFSGGRRCAPSSAPRPPNDRGSAFGSVYALERRSGRRSGRQPETEEPPPPPRPTLFYLAIFCKFDHLYSRPRFSRRIGRTPNERDVGAYAENGQIPIQSSVTSFFPFTAIIALPARVRPHTATRRRPGGRSEETSRRFDCATPEASPMMLSGLLGMSSWRVPAIRTKPSLSDGAGILLKQTLPFARDAGNSLTSLTFSESDGVLYADTQMRGWVRSKYKFEMVDLIVRRKKEVVIFSALSIRLSVGRAISVNLYIREDLSEIQSLMDRRSQSMSFA
ncbi:hypothetical protein GEV33_008476 [Tenebrio molitor]|uniref:Out at first protein BRICHOS-like domain-containing protein n=1 Tax=Tenebrio molitor TaxID=7067 RepID=A0A8J6LC85_TENMO|nr:hypothetical protein GEV33_008476 [Tenebrio molitor]